MIGINKNLTVCTVGRLRYAQLSLEGEMRKRLIVALILSVIVLAVGTVGCNNKPSSSNGTSELLGVSMYVEKSQYPSNISKINVVWKNDTDKDLTFGNPFTIQVQSSRFEAC